MACCEKGIYRPEYRGMLARLRQARAAAGLGQKAVAARLRRPPSFVSKCESGERRVDPIELLDFARLYGRPVGHFLEGGEDEEMEGSAIEPDKPVAAAAAPAPNGPVQPPDLPGRAVRLVS